MLRVFLMISEIVYFDLNLGHVTASESGVGNYLRRDSDAGWKEDLSDGRGNEKTISANYPKKIKRIIQ